MPLIDRDEVLQRVDLVELATELCGMPRGRGAGRKWHCPSPNHPDEHPSMGVFRSTRGHQRWKCHACGEGGTAVDLLMISSGLGAGDALRDLARSVGLDPTPIGGSPPPRQRPKPPTRQPAPALPREPSTAVEAFVARAAELLWQPIGSGARAHLQARGFAQHVLHANRVGFDPGPRPLPRPDGLPRRGPGIVYPALRPGTGVAVYYQVRYLDPGRSGRKYDQPVAALAPNPHLTTLRNDDTPPDRPPAPLVVVCEGFPDALTAAHTGLTAVAVLGVSHASAFSADALASRLLGAHPGTAFAIYFDADDHAEKPGKPPAGQIAAGRLAAHLADRGATVARLVPPAGFNDLNEWWQADPNALIRELIDTSAMLAPAPERTLRAATPEVRPL